MRGRSIPVVRPLIVGLAITAVLLLVMIALPPSVDDGQSGSEEAAVATADTTSSTSSSSTSSTTTVAPYDGWVDPASSGAPWGSAVEGLLTFRGNPTRTYYGEGPVPDAPQILWKFPDEPMCTYAPIGRVSTWCGTGWTGQPSVWDRDGETWVAFGAYSTDIHILDADDGSRRIPAFDTGAIIKGSVTVDPDGFPLLYSGSRDNFYRVIAFDGDEPRELWKLAATDVSPTMWNDDWDGSGLVIDDHLFIGGENSRIHIVKLNRGYAADGTDTVDPEIVWHAAGWDDELIAAVGENVSIENSVAISGDVLYFANSGGLVQGWDIAGVDEGVEPTRVFRYWAGDDVDASLVIDEEGMIYVGVEYERGNTRSLEIGQVL